MNRAFLFSLLCVAAAACVVTNPIKTANTVQQKAYATYGTFVVFEELAAKVVSTGGVSDRVKSDIAKADAVAKPTMDLLLTAVQAVDTLQVQLAAGQTTPEKLTAAVLALNTLLAQATPQVNDLVKAVQGAK